MEQQEKLKLLASLHLLDHIPKNQLASLSDYMEARVCKAGETVFEEGSKGDGLYFISSGRIRISKKMIQADGSTAFKDLAILNPGDCLGEMTLFEDVPRSAQAVSAEDSVLFKLGRQELRQWLQSNPPLAMEFFIELVQTLSKRLRRSSNELTLLFDVSQWLLEPIMTGHELLKKILSHMLPHLEGPWSAGAYLYNEYNAEMELVAAEGSSPEAQPQLKIPSPKTAENAWLDDHTYFIPLPAKQRLGGYLVFHTPAELTQEEKNEAALTLTTTARLVASTLENINHRNEEAMRARLSTSRQHYASGL